MKRPLKERVSWLIAVTALAITVCVLAFLQIRWSHELDEAASARMRANLQASIVGVRLDFTRELAGIPHPAHDSNATETQRAASYAEIVQRWKVSAAHPELISAIFLANGNVLRRLDVENKRYVPAQWPPSLASLKENLGSLTQVMMAPPQHARTHHHGRPPDHDAPPSAPPESHWFIAPEASALLDPAPPEPGAADAAPTWIIVELDQQVLREQVLPELAERYFGGNTGLSYDVAVFAQPDSRLIYSSSPQIHTREQIPPDARIALFGFPFIGGHAGGRIDPRSLPILSPDQRGGMFRLEPLRLGDHHTTWELVVKHRKGSLEAALASLRRQHLVLSFGALLILVVTIVMVILATRRAQRLAQQQMDFVAGVSHELRTPLAVIASAGDNIADGIITDRDKIVRYGDVIRKHARQLTQLVEQILLFAAARKQSFQFNITRLKPADIVRTAIDRSPELHSASFTVQQEIEPNLPDVLADASAVSHCLQNLISNAVKYSGDSRWLAIHARLAPEGRAVQISVEDKGIGISREQLRRIFDPFYRSPEVVSAQIRGTGLGLALARSIAESLGGRLSATSVRGKGSTFTLELPIAGDVSVPASMTTAAAAGTKDETENPDR